MTPNLKLLKPEPVAPPYLFELQYCKPDPRVFSLILNVPLSSFHCEHFFRCNLSVVEQVNGDLRILLFEYFGCLWMAREE